MEDILLAFIDTLDTSLKRLVRSAGDDAGLARLTISQLQYIDAIHASDGPTITQLADRLQITKASVTAGIQKLIALGFVIKTQSELDRRVAHVSLTEAGQRLAASRDQVLREYRAFIRTSLTEEEARQLEAILAKLVRCFE